MWCGHRRRGRALGSWALGSWLVDIGFKAMDFGLLAWILGSGLWILGSWPGSWPLMDKLVATNILPQKVSGP